MVIRRPFYPASSNINATAKLSVLLTACVRARNARTFPEWTNMIVGVASVPIGYQVAVAGAVRAWGSLLAAMAMLVGGGTREEVPRRWHVWLAAPAAPEGGRATPPGAGR